MRAGALIGGCAVGLSVSWNLTNTGAVASVLGGHYRVGLATVGLLTAVAFLAEFVVMLPGGWAIDRFGAKRVSAVALGLVLAGNILLLVLPGIALALVMRWVVGLGVGAGFVAGAVYVQSGDRASAALAQGIYGGVSLSGAGLALAVVPALEGWLGWRTPYVTGVFVVAVAMAVLVPCPQTAGDSGGGERVPLRRVLVDPQIAGLGVLHAASFGFSVIIGNWVVTLLERAGGFETGAAGAAGALTMILGVLGRPLGGWLSRRHPGATGQMLAGSVIAGGLATALLAVELTPALDVLAAAVIGLAAGIPFGPVVTGATQAHPRAPGTAVGAMNLYPVVTIIAGAPLLGLAFDLPGDGRIGFAVLAGLWAAAILVIPRLTVDQRGAPAVSPARG